MLGNSTAFSGFAAPDLGAAKKFYEETLGLKVEQDEMGLKLKLANGNEVFVYQKDDYTPAVFTVLYFTVDDIDKTIDELATKGVRMERYDNLPAEQDDKGVLRGRAAGMGPDIAWFTDPAGNILAVLQN